MILSLLDDKPAPIEELISQITLIIPVPKHSSVSSKYVWYRTAHGSYHTGTVECSSNALRNPFVILIYTEGSGNATQ
jgi:hypothetical protein